MGITVSIYLAKRKTFMTGTSVGEKSEKHKACEIEPRTSDLRLLPPAPTSEACS